MVNHNFEDQDVCKIQKRIEKIIIDNHKSVFPGESSVLLLNIYEAMKVRDKEGIVKLIEEIKTDNNLNNALTKFKQKYRVIFISLAEKIIEDRLLEAEKSFSVLNASIVLIEEAHNRDEVIQVVLAGISEYIKRMDIRMKKSSHYLIQSVKEHIHRSINTKINIAALADEIGTNSSYLSRLFHQKEGITIQQFICQERIRQAEQLLQSSTFTYEEISRCVGFTSPSYFGNILKKITGLTPTQYRQQYRTQCKESNVI